MRLVQYLDGYSKTTKIDLYIKFTDPTVPNPDIPNILDISIRHNPTLSNRIN